MKRFIFFLFYFPLVGLGQNFVPNPSFENYSSCPVGTGQVNLAIPWIDPTISSSDYFNSCSASLDVSSPNNWNPWGGVQFPRSGNGYAGFLALVPNSREYIQIELIDSLTAGIEYRAEFYVSLRNFQKYAIDNMGIYFSAAPITGPVATVLNYIPQIANPSGNYLIDTLNWMPVAGTFIAVGGERYITIGNFDSDSLTNKIIVNYSASDTLSSYYYIDDVSVYPDSITSVNEIKQTSEFTLYPNPATDQLFIAVTDKEIKSAAIEITDITGKLVYASKINIENLTAKLNLELENGVYLIRIMDANNKPSVQKIMINK